MIDFTDFPVRKKTYAGANGSKISVVYNGSIYMLKFPALPTRNPGLSYTNSCISEYLGCKIFESVGIPVQEVLPGAFSIRKTERKSIFITSEELNILPYKKMFAEQERYRKYLLTLFESAVDALSYATLPLTSMSNNPVDK